ncbi:MAG: hypothetical protein RL324_2291 [Verrucomicrobiota bacterium]|jgi:hypothetical protein
MLPEEFYIRSVSETEARGPFNLEQVTSLAEAGQVTLETLYYEPTTETWVAAGENAEVKAAIWPEKKKLTINKGHKIAKLNTEDDSAAPISVNDMLAAAEGRTAETRDKADPQIAMAIAAKIGMWSAIVTLLLAAAAEVLPSLSVLLDFNVENILVEPLVILGVLDVVLGLLLVLGMASIYPFLRFRAAFGFGFIGFLAWVHGTTAHLAFAAFGSAGLYLCTVFVAYVPVGIAAALGVLGMGGYAWFALNS